MGNRKKISLYAIFGIMLTILLVFGVFSNNGNLSGNFFKGKTHWPTVRHKSSVEIKKEVIKTQALDCSNKKPLFKMLSSTSDELKKGIFDAYTFSITAPRGCPMEFYEIGSLHMETSLGNILNGVEADADEGAGSYDQYIYSSLSNFELVKVQADGNEVLASEKQQVQAYPVLNPGDTSESLLSNLFHSENNWPFESSYLDIDRDGIYKADLRIVFPFNDFLQVKGGETVVLKLKATAKGIRAKDFVSFSMVPDKYPYHGALRHIVTEQNNGTFLVITPRYMSSEYTNKFIPGMLWSNKSEIPHWGASTDWFGSSELDLPTTQRLLMSKSSDEKIYTGNPYNSTMSVINKGQGMSELKVGKELLLDFAIMANEEDIVFTPQIQGIYFWVKEFTDAEVQKYWLKMDGSSSQMTEYTVEEENGGWKLLRFPFPDGYKLRKHELVKMALYGNVVNSKGDIAILSAGIQGNGVESHEQVGIFGEGYPYNIASGFKQGVITVIDARAKSDNLVKGEQELIKFKLRAANEDMWLRFIDIRVHVSSYDNVGLSPNVVLVDEQSGLRYNATIDTNNDGQTWVDLEKPIRLKEGEPLTFSLMGTVEGNLAGPSAIYTFLDKNIYSEGIDSGTYSDWEGFGYEIFLEGRASHTLKYLP